MNRAAWTTVVHAVRRTRLPLVSYYTVTLAVPLANGAAPSDAFREHALVVLAVPPVAIMLACAVHTTARILASTYRAAGAHARRSVGAARLNRLPLRQRWPSESRVPSVRVGDKPHRR